VRREFLRRATRALAAAGIERPYPQRTVWLRGEAASAGRPG
jgi:small-conductance mechanosensitive channel